MQLKRCTYGYMGVVILTFYNEHEDGVLMEISQDITERKIKGLQPFQFKGRVETTAYVAGRMRNRSCSLQYQVFHQRLG
jgi:hypothetical protein